MRRYVRVSLFAQQGVDARDDGLGVGGTRVDLRCVAVELDAQIAAICRELGAVLATRNIKDFEETGVDLVDPWQADA